MRSALLAIAVMLAGCASSPENAPANTTPTPSATAPGSTPDTESARQQQEVKPGVVLDETHDYTDPPRQSFFNVTGAERTVVINITSSGPPADGSFQSATLHLYFPRTTSPFLAELPGQEAHTFEIRQQPHEGTWKLDYLGTGKVTVAVRVSLE